MNFLSQVLSSAEQTDVEIIKQKLPVVMQRVSGCKQEVMNYMDDCYHNFSQYPNTRPVLKNKIDNFNSEFKDLSDRIQNINKGKLPEKVKEFGCLTSELVSVSVELNFLTQLIEIHELFIETRNLKGKQSYFECAAVLAKIKKLIDNLPQDELPILVSLKSELDCEVTECSSSLEECYLENVIIDDRTVENVTTNFLKINTDFDFAPLISAFVCLTGDDLEILNDLSEFVYHCFCEPVIKNVTIVKVETEGSYKILTVHVKKNSSNENYKDIFEKLKEIFAFLKKNFTYTFDDFTTTTYIAEHLNVNFWNVLKDHCLKLIIADLKAKGDVRKTQEFVADMKSFVHEMVDFDIQTSNSTLDLLNDFETYLINQKCDEFLHRSVIMMKKDLHDLVEIANDSRNEFPKCCVSRSAVELLNLTETLLAHPKDESEAYLNSLMSTTHSIFDQYGDVVYKHHEKFLKSIPQQVALFRNNLMYVAFRLSKFSETFKFPNIKTASLFAPLSIQLIHMANRIFSEYIEQQIKQMETTLSEYQFDSQHLSDTLHPETDRCIRQCIRQYELLKTVWLKVLPLDVYNQALSQLLNNFCKKLIDIVISTEDLPSKNSEQLVNMFKVILSRGPKLFDDAYEINLYVNNWRKLNDLCFILGANLMEIHDRWADGKGPLTLYFKAEEVRRLIKALFQNSQRRDAVLNRI